MGAVEQLLSQVLVSLLTVLLAFGAQRCFFSVSAAPLHETVSAAAESERRLVEVEATTTTSEEEKEEEEKRSNEEPPAELVCPISHEVMRDPVVAEDGHSYERSEIETWFAAGHGTSPRTRQRMTELRLVPNLALRAQVDEYRSRMGLAPLPPRRSEATRVVVSESNDGPQVQNDQRGPQTAPGPNNANGNVATLQLGQETAHRVAAAVASIIRVAPDRAAAAGVPTTNPNVATHFVFRNASHMRRLAEAVSEVDELQHHSTLLGRLADQQQGVASVAADVARLNAPAWRADDAARHRLEVRLMTALRDDDLDAISDLLSNHQQQKKRIILSPPARVAEILLAPPPETTTFDDDDNAASSSSNNSSRREDDSILHYASCNQGSILEWMLEAVSLAEAETPSKLDGATCLHLAAMYDARRCLRALLAKGCDPNARALGIAFNKSLLRGAQSARGLVHRRPFCVIDTRPLHVACAVMVERSRVPVMEILLGAERQVDLTARDNMGATPLHCAASACDVPAMLTLIKALKNKYALNDLRQWLTFRDFTPDRATPLHRFCMTTSPLARAFRDDHGLPVEAFEAFLGAISGNTQEEIMDSEQKKLLLEDQRTSMGFACMHLAAANVNAHNVNAGASLVEALLNAGASGSLKSTMPQGTTPLHDASAHGKVGVVRLLLRHGVAESKDDFGRTATHVSVYKRAPVACVAALAAQAHQDGLLDATDIAGHSALHSAAIIDSVHAARALLDAGADPDVSSGPDEDSPLFLACEHNAIRVAKLLMERGATVNKRKRDGTTPLHKAAAGGLIAMAKHLIHAGADSRIPSHSGSTPIQLASLLQDTNMFDLLQYYPRPPYYE